VNIVANTYNGDGVDLVVDEQATHVDTIAFDDIDEVVDRAIFANQDFAVVQAILVKDRLDLCKQNASKKTKNNQRRHEDRQKVHHNDSHKLHQSTE
jgi:hypothetical protein